MTQRPLEAIAREVYCTGGLTDAASALNHPNITTIHAIGETESVLYIAMELVEGKTLREILATGPLSIKRLLQIATQITDGWNGRRVSSHRHATVADLSADGKTLLFYEWGEGVAGTLTVFLRKTDEPDATRLGEGRPLSLSPDGRWAVVVRQTTPQQLALLPTGPGQERTLPSGAVIDYLDWAAWSPDSRRVFFAARDSAGQQRTYVQDIRRR